MAGVAIRLGLVPPAKAPGPWFPEWATRDVACWRVQAGADAGPEAPEAPRRRQLAKVPRLGDQHIYIGRGAAGRKLLCSVWHNPFTVAKYGRREAVGRFREMVLQSSRLMRQLPFLAGKVLVCHCAEGEECHADALIELFRENVNQPAETIYVGQSEKYGRHARTCWASPFVPGQHGTHAECVAKYVAWFQRPTQGALKDRLPDLKGKQLACECEVGQPCHADFLAAQVMASGQATPRHHRRGRPLPQLVMATLVAAGKAQQIPQAVGVRWPQWSVDMAFRRLFPADYTAGMPFPNIEDLVNGVPFACFPMFLEDQGIDADHAQPPTLLSSFRRGWRRAAEGEQKGDMFTKGAAQQTVSLGLDPERHMAEALRVAKVSPFPLDEVGAVESDLACAAASTIHNLEALHEWRGACYKQVAELAKRLEATSQHLRRWQQGSVATVSAKIHVAPVGVAVVLTSCQ